ncbi:glycosyltransferase family 2 protein [Winogradskyella wichelsiae]|uniref:glycosyltransferase family 2 protein n=1 Tax=Winogradskyella wichelsiae TaxID=2697007 RepID=UPI0015C86C82|nr:glycosyltransferase family 2 protein [Winogradskyella wichelsiae]
MRKGVNPKKKTTLINSDYTHQVILPVYIPNNNDYFNESLEILKYCITSLKLTIHKFTFVTIVDNGCSAEVRNYLQELYNKGEINELIQTTTIGKINAVLKGIIGHDFLFITIADSDVLFCNGWQEETYKVFGGFPKAGFVTTTPNSKLIKYKTGAVLLSNIWNSKMLFTKVKNKKALQRFAESIGNFNLFQSIHLEKNLSIESETGIKALIGGGHFVGTYRGEIFKNQSFKSSKHSMGGASVSAFLDNPIVKYNLWRLATEDNYTYHMGNIVENWMQQELDKIVKKDIDTPILNLIVPKKLNIFEFFCLKFFERILMNRWIWPLFLNYKGLLKEEAKSY